MSDADKNAHVCKIRDAVEQARLALIPLPAAMKEWQDSQEGDRRLLAYMDSFPPLREGQEWEEYTAILHYIRTPHFPALKAMCERQRAMDDPFKEFRRHARAAEELVLAASPWLPQLAAMHNLDTPGKWTTELLTLLGWGMGHGPRTTDPEWVWDLVEKLTCYFIELRNLATFTKSDAGKPTEDEKPKTPNQQPPADQEPQFPTVAVGNDTFSLYVGRDSEGFICNGERCRVADTNQGWEVLKIMWPPIDGREFEGRAIRKELDIDDTGNPKQWAASNAKSVRTALESVPAMPFRVGASGGKLVWEQLPKVM